MGSLPFLLFLFGRVAAAQTLTEREVIERARTRDPNALSADREVAVAEGERLRASLYTNPSVSWEREAVPSSPAEREDTFALTVPVELGGSRAARTALARAGVTSAQAAAGRTRTRAVVRSLLAFYEALAAQHRAAIAERAAARLAEAARILEKRHVQGETSGYERTRIELEAEVARSELRVARAEAQTQRAELAMLIGLNFRTMELRGSFAADRRALTTAERQSVRLTRSAARQATAAGDSAASAWIPNVALSGGLRIRETDQTQYGYVAGVSVSLPLFAHGQDVRAEAKAVASFLDAQVAAVERDARLETLRAEHDMRSMRSELATFAEQTSARLERMLRAAESGYREGERTILELLDAQRTQTAVDRRRLDLELAAKRAEISLRAARGEFE